MSRFVPNPRFPEQMATDPGVRRVLKKAADAVAADAEQMGKQISPSYTVTVADGRFGGVQAGRLQLRANTGGINAASWIEWGTADLPAVAPLRSAVEQAGLDVEGGKN